MVSVDLSSARRCMTFGGFALFLSSALALADCPVHIEHFSQGQSTYHVIRSSLKAVENDLIAPRFEWVDAGPPPNHGDTTCAEIKYLHELEAMRPAKQAEILCEVDLSCFKLGDFTMAEDGSRVHYPLTYKLLQDELALIDPIISHAKRQFDRPRPNQVDPTLTTLIPVPNHAAYPSGHTTNAMLMAYTLGQLNPDQQLAYFQDAIRIGRNREIAGVHYPSDTEGGGRLAHAFFDYLMTQPSFQEELAAAATEWH